MFRTVLENSGNGRIGDVNIVLQVCGALIDNVIGNSVTALKDLCDGRTAGHHANLSVAVRGSVAAKCDGLSG